MSRIRIVNFFLRFLPFLFVFLLLVFLLLPSAVTVKLTHIFFSLAFLLLFLTIVLATLASPPPRGLLVKVNDGAVEQYFYPGASNLFYLLPDRRPPEVLFDENIRYHPIPLIEIRSWEDTREVRFRLMQGVVCRQEKVVAWGAYAEFSETEIRDAKMGRFSWKFKLMEL